ncbi:MULTISPECIES: Mfa1 family fimbria major subunit [Bacteroides]|uniref:Minor fimbrium subunit Mfa1 C-terminal domain-containing protein n=1 Tax=Bacteroides fragilis TaxID=817 RepID=A0A0I9SA57_BACFG|nr:Mfa1 family fimbria major subunit [Bacteroides fragilis]MCM0196669.1 Mfa1 fimbrilin C-terminal domain-containing protein [Bacteroides fragilis]MCM0199834.1 Mfa1 fimbrilin C-terminal domain-containing protein [Bacteroides fragilis]MCM0209860.1 Mfa1 fimbrilin C-terminal domain-containing protein [Bacteroides fragilis]MCM0214839.1 Mfa1 fimbrilin C-terminal domain-containing protein [Bacteroides fragilis]MCM0226513.1 Mfa1 fimbrilin C-terminal domain-containing protein [Bacteroides fragilis]
MKRLKYMSMMGLAALLLTTWSACSDDTDIPGGENPEEARAYTTVTIAVPNGVAETRAGTTADTDDDNTTEAGSEDEYKVKTANLYLFPGGAGSSFGSATLKEIISINQFTQMTASTADAKTIVWTSKKTALTPGDYRIYIVVNGTVNGVTDGSKNSLTEADFLAKTTADATGVIAAVPEAGLVMASRSPKSDNMNTLPYIAQTITKDPEQTIAATVERMMGKITVTAGGANVASAANVYTSFSTTVTAIGNITNITLTGYYVVNARKEGYYFRHVDKESTATNPLTEANYGNSTTSLPYVVDPKTYSKTYSGTPAALAGSYADWYLQGSGAFGLLSFGSFGGTYTAMPGYSSAAAETKVAAYCYENTMLKDKQKNGYTTGIVFKAEIAPSKMMQKKAGSGGVEENSTFTSMSEIYYHSGIFYKNIEALKAAGVLLADGTTSSSASGAPADLKKNDVQCFKRGDTNGKFICYYPYWIKHIPSENTAEDVMEFGIVRNNVYKVTVTGIQGVGKDGVTEDIITDTETDDPTTVLLNVKLSIKPWTVRANSAVLGR